MGAPSPRRSAACRGFWAVSPGHAPRKSARPSRSGPLAPLPRGPPRGHVSKPGLDGRWVSLRGGSGPAHPCHAARQTRLSDLNDLARHPHDNGLEVEPMYRGAPWGRPGPDGPRGRTVGDGGHPNRRQDLEPQRGHFRPHLHRRAGSGSATRSRPWRRDLLWKIPRHSQSTTSKSVRACRSRPSRLGERSAHPVRHRPPASTPLGPGQAEGDAVG